MNEYLPYQNAEVIKVTPSNSRTVEEGKLSLILEGLKSIKQYTRTQLASHRKHITYTLQRPES
jgi:hypothetical protein